jgi:hypothetical protein
LSHQVELTCRGTSRYVLKTMKICGMYITSLQRSVILLPSLLADFKLGLGQSLRRRMDLIAGRRSTSNGCTKGTNGLIYRIIRFIQSPYKPHLRGRKGISPRLPLSHSTNPQTTFSSGASSSTATATGQSKESTASLQISGKVVNENDYVRLGAFHTLDLEGISPTSSGGGTMADI